MSNFKMKTYSDSYFYNKAGAGGSNMMKEHDKTIINFIMRAERLNKKDPAFSSILDDVKRTQTSSILYTVLMMPNVYLCTNSVEMTGAFKVFEAFDIKSQDRKPAIFIDVTKIIKKKNDYYICTNVGKLISYLFGALTYILYRKDPVRMTNNSNITISSLECYVAMFSYVLDYLRIIGYSQNKEKVSYMVALFYLHNMMGKDLDAYTKNLALKVSNANIPANALDLYLEDGMFENIDTFIGVLADTFKLKGLTTEVFIHKWIYQFGGGTQFGAELFTSFSVMLTHAFSGAYVINQKQIERCCGQSMVKYGNSLLKLGTEMIEISYTRESMMPKDRNVIDMARYLEKRKDKDFSRTRLITTEDFNNSAVLKEKLENNIKYFIETREKDKLFNVIESTVAKSADLMRDYIRNAESEFDLTCMQAAIDAGLPYVDRAIGQRMLYGVTVERGNFLDELRALRDNEDEKKLERCKAVFNTINKVQKDLNEKV